MVDQLRPACTNHAAAVLPIIPPCLRRFINYSTSIIQSSTMQQLCSQKTTATVHWHWQVLKLLLCFVQSQSLSQQAESFFAPFHDQFLSRSTRRKNYPISRAHRERRAPSGGIIPREPSGSGPVAVTWLFELNNSLRTQLGPPGQTSFGF